MGVVVVFVGAKGAVEMRGRKGRRRVSRVRVGNCIFGFCGRIFAGVFRTLGLVVVGFQWWFAWYS